MRWIEVGQTNEIPAGTMKPVVVEGKEILVVNVGGSWFALGRYCTHLHGDLSLGKLEGKVVTCPRHGSRFDVTSGVSISGPKIGLLKLKTKDEPSYPLQVEGQRIKIGIE